MIFSIDKLLSTDELSYLNKICKNFKISDSPTTREQNYYNRHFIDEKTELLQFQKKVKTYLDTNFSFKYNIRNIWINQITTETNRNDGFHIDDSDNTIVTFINDDFDGGEFEYIDIHNNSIKVLPKINNSVLITDKVKHRVLPIENGIRYTLVTFIEIITKSNKSLL